MDIRTIEIEGIEKTAISIGPDDITIPKHLMPRAWLGTGHISELSTWLDRWASSQRSAVRNSTMKCVRSSPPMPVALRMEMWADE